MPDRGDKCSREDWASHLTEEQRMAPVTERVVLLVSECLGEGWETVGLRLGLSYACVQRCKVPRCMLDKWRMKEGGKATVDVLVNVLQESVYTCTVDMLDESGVFNTLLIIHTQILLVGAANMRITFVQDH
ncbi:uncharacterized protein LOC124265383 [Haliotis rubra]|uniref:uncharacterized protein LOC124265383 n=1 Tax=Haliotis rubra TaxID=36100 RepID=UPI001EE55408|nr:uncharacterized protein LOC124265383 [Haliotis rubra]